MTRILFPGPHTSSSGRSRVHSRWRMPWITTGVSVGRGMGPSGAFAFRVCKRCRGVVPASDSRCSYCHPPRSGAMPAVLRAFAGRVGRGLMFPLDHLIHLFGGRSSPPSALPPQLDAAAELELELELDLDAAIAVVRAGPRPSAWS